MGSRSFLLLAVASTLLVMVYHTPTPAHSDNPQLHDLAHSLASPHPTTGLPDAADATAAAAGANEASPSSSHRTPGSKPLLVILGSGWGAVSTLKGLDVDQYEITVISPRNYFLFTPLLPSATTGQVESRSLMEPIRRICHRVGARYYESRAVDVDPVKRLVSCKSYSGLEFTLPYDHLVVAVGAKNNTFNTPGVTEYTYYLKEIKHARKIRHKLLSLLEEASLPGLSKEERERMLHFVVVGGGPTGVEFAGEFHDLLVEDVRTLFPDLTEHVSLSLIQSNDHILNTYDLRISEVAERQFRKLDINLITGARVKEVKPDAVIYLDKKSKQLMELPFGMCVWSTGIDVVAITKALMHRLEDGQDPVKGKVLLTDNKLRVRGRDAEHRIYAIGDCASVSLTHALYTDPVMQQIFDSTDSDHDGRLSYVEFVDLLDVAIREAPILASSLQVSDRRQLFDKYDSNHDDGIDFNEFKAIIKDMEAVKSYPATAQVASQQGEYLAQRFNALAKRSRGVESREDVVELEGDADRPFRYHHLGNLAYIGGEHAAIDLGGGRNLSGFAAYWLWKSVYFSTSVSTRTRLLLLSDWTRTAVFGRDVSKR